MRDIQDFFINLFSNFRLIFYRHIFYITLFLYILSRCWINSILLLRFFRDNEKNIYRNLEGITLKPEKNQSYLISNETCYNNYIQPTYTNMKHLLMVDSRPNARDHGSKQSSRQLINFKLAVNNANRNGGQFPNRRENQECYPIVSSPKLSNFTKTKTFALCSPMC